MTETKVDYHELWVRLNRPSPERFQAALKKRGLVSPGIAFLREHFYRWQSAKQLFQRPPKYTGHVYSPHLNSRWVADIMVNTQRPEEHEGKAWSFALIVQDIFSRFAWARLIDSPMAADEGLRSILGKAGTAPGELLTDADPGFKTPAFRALLAEKRIVQDIRAGRNDMATVDRLIFTLKRAMAEHAAETGEQWAARLQDAVSSWNESGTGHLYGSAPEDAMEKKSPGLEFNLEWDAAHDMADNAKQIHTRAAKLQNLGAYRTLVPIKGLKRRANQPIWSREMHKADAVKGAFVGRHPTKEVLAVPEDSSKLAPEKVQLNAAARQSLWRYASRVSGFLSTAADNRASPNKVYNLMLEVAGSRENLVNAFKIAGVTAKELVSSLVKIYPDRFKSEGGKVVYIGA